MAQKKFYLESQSGKLQQIGLRAQVVSFIMEHGINSGNVINDSGNKQKVIVAIEYKSEPIDETKEIEVINSVRNELVTYLNHLKDSDPECYNHFPTDIKATELTALNNPTPISISDLNRLSSILMLEQTSKGVGAMISLPDKLAAAISKTLKEEFKELKEIPSALRDLAEKISK